MASEETKTISGRRQRAFVGPLSNDFLRVGDHVNNIERQDAQTAQYLQAQENRLMFNPAPQYRLGITITQAKLTKNYGFTKMDPYCKIRLGHTVFESHTNYNGAKNPSWNKTFYCNVPHGIDSIYLEIYDERTVSVDERIAWAHIPIPEGVYNGDTAEEWYPLNGKEGDGKEGMINLVFSYTQAPPPSNVMVFPNPGMTQQAPIYYPGVGGMPVYIPQQNPVQHQVQNLPMAPTYTEADLKQVKEMFPDVEDSVIKAVFEANQGNKDGTINSLLQMNDEN